MPSDPARPARAPQRSPGVPARPPFAFRMTAPQGWEALRGDSASLRDDLVALVARTALWAALDDRRRRGLATILGGVARASAASGAVATLLRLPTGQVAPGTEPDVATISLTWLRTAPVLADLDLAHLVLRGGDPVETGLGPALVVRRAEETITGAAQITTQVAAPVPDSIWLAVLTGTATSPENAPAMDEAVLAVAASLGVERPARAGRATPDGAQPEPARTAEDVTRP